MRELKKWKKIDEYLQEIFECFFTKNGFFRNGENELNCSVTLKGLLKLKSYQIYL